MSVLDGRRPRVLVVDFMNHRRLALMDSLGSHFAPEGLPAEAELLRHVRAAQPDMVLLFVHPWRPEKAPRSCRWLKTDGRPVRRVALINIDAPRRDPASVMGREMADGYWQGPARAVELAGFAREVWAGQRPVVVKPSPLGLLARLLRRS